MSKRDIIIFAEYKTNIFYYDILSTPCYVSLYHNVVDRWKKMRNKTQAKVDKNSLCRGLHIASWAQSVRNFFKRIKSYTTLYIIWVQSVFINLMKNVVKIHRCIICFSLHFNTINTYNLFRMYVCLYWRMPVLRACEPLLKTI